jgi:hypothetical protein
MFAVFDLIDAFKSFFPRYWLEERCFLIGAEKPDFSFFEKK